jgi:hypothetical protein
MRSGTRSGSRGGFSADDARGIPTGKVVFKDGSKTLKTVQLDSNGVASYATSALTVGTHTITAVYSAEDVFSGSQGAVSHRVIFKLMPAPPPPGTR